MEHILGANTKVLTHITQMSAWIIKKGDYIMTEDKPYWSDGARKTFEDLYTFDIQTKFRHYVIVCSKGTCVATDRGSKPISMLKEGDSICVRGAFIKKRLTMITKIERKYIDYTAAYTIKTDAPEMIVEGIYVKTY